MLRGTLAGLVSSLAILSSAYAADMYVPGPVGGYKDAYVPVDTWAGFYVGGNGGYAWGNDLNVSINYNRQDGSPAPSFAPEGGFGGGQIGYNWQGWVYPYLVLGIEADIQGAGISGSATDTVSGATATAENSLDWFGTVRGRLGYSFGRALVYATGGFAYGGVQDKLSVDPSVIKTVSHDHTATGYVAGGGVEYKLTPAWSVKAEYQYIDLGSERLTLTYGGATGTANFDHAYDTVRLGINYHFLPTYEPLK